MRQEEGREKEGRRKGEGREKEGRRKREGKRGKHEWTVSAEMERGIHSSP
jgi:hypothetical protein